MFWEKTDYRAETQRLQNELTAITAEKFQLENQLEDTLDSVQKSAEAQLTYKNQLQDHKKVMDELVAKHTAEMEVVKNSLNKRVNTTLASIGVTNFANENFSVTIDTTDREALNTFNALSGQEKTEYYNKNKAKISRALLPKV